MGQFSVQATITHPGDARRSAEVGLLVDTGATLSWIPRDVLDRLGVPRLARVPSFLPTEKRSSATRLAY